MNKQIHTEIMKIEDKGVSDVELLALVTDTSYEVVFYAKHDGIMRQSNDLAEDGVLTLDFVDETYSTVANAIREDKNYVSGKMNIVMASEKEFSLEHDENSCGTYKIKKKWKSLIGV